MANTLSELAQITDHPAQDWHTVDYQALINAGNVKAWNNWRDQIWASDSDFDIDLSGLDLSGLSFVGADLSYVRMVGTNLEGADLSQVDAQYADLRGARLTPEPPHFTDLTCADFTHANLLDVIWDPDRLKVHGLILDDAELPRGKNFKWFPH